MTEQDKAIRESIDKMREDLSARLEADRVAIRKQFPLAFWPANACPLCGAHVYPMQQQTHREWHVGLLQ